MISISQEPAPIAVAIPISGDLVKRNTEALKAAGDIDEDAADNILWLFEYARSHALSYSRLGALVGIDGSSVSRVFSAKYSAGYDGINKKIAAFRSLAEERGIKRTVGFIETQTWKKIDAVCRNALVEQMPAFIYGPSQIGKTTCLLEHQRRASAGSVRYVRMPACPSPTMFVRLLATACRVSPNQPLDILRVRIADAIDARHLIIIDEFHQAFITASSRRGIALMEIIREIYDRTGCGLVLAATKTGETELERGKNAPIYEQLRRRGMTKLVLPEMPSKSDIIKIASFYGLQSPEGDTLSIVRDMLRTSGIGMFCKFLAAASSFAVRQKQPLTWESFSTVYTGLNELTIPTK